MPISKICKSCNNSFIAFRLFEKVKFCSRKCASENKKIIFKGKKNPFFGKKHTKETLIKLSKKLKGRSANSGTFNKNGRKFTDENHPLWKGEKASYSAKHKWIKLKLGVADYCEHCKTKTAERYDWHNISREYKRDIRDWISLCRHCHYKYDRKMVKYKHGTKNNSNF